MSRPLTKEEIDYLREIVFEDFRTLFWDADVPLHFRDPPRTAEEFDAADELQKAVAAEREKCAKEAIAVLNKRYMGDNNREDMEVRRCVEDLKKHFGVEE